MFTIERLNSSSSTKPTKKIQDWNTFADDSRAGKHNYRAGKLVISILWCLALYFPHAYNNNNSKNRV
jgi:hypothetical protein